MKELLEVLRVQRHNFLNHLQVISGLLQLKKYDRVTDYIIQIGSEYNRDSLVGRLEVPEIAATILTSDLNAGKHGITINKEVSTNLDKGIKYPAGTAEVLREMLNIAISQFEDTSRQERMIGLEIDEVEGEYTFKAVLPFTDQIDVLEDKLKILREKVDTVNGELGINSSENCLTVMSFIVPAGA